MSPNIFDWHKLIAGIVDETFGIPPDVVFQIVENGELHEIKAHKMILAMVSLPFKTMFYTTEVGDRTSKAIKIEQTTAPAFQIMIDAIYETKSIEESLKGKSVQEVFDVLHLIEQYQIAELAEAIEKYLADYPVTDDSVLEVAAEASQYTTLFQKEAQHLLLTCAKFLKPKLKDVQSIFKYASKTDQKEVFSILLALMEAIKCPNCGYENCQDGKPIKEDDFRVGLIVTNNRKNGYYWDQRSDKGKGNVTSVNARTVKVAGEEFGNYVYRKTDPGAVDVEEFGNYVYRKTDGNVEVSDEEFGDYADEEFKNSISDGQKIFRFFCK